MGVSNSPAELSRKITSAARAIGKANREAVKAAALVYKDSALMQGRRDTGGDLRLSRGGAKLGGGNRRGIKLGAGFDIRGFENATAIMKARPAGPWKWLEYGTAAHDLAPKSTRSKRKALRFPDGNVRRLPIRHPGAKGKGTWSEGIDRGTPGAMQAFRRVQALALAEQFR